MTAAVRSRRAPATPAQEQAWVAEHDIAWIRFAVIVFNVLLYAALLPHGARHGLAVGVALVALAYGLLVVVARPYERFPVLHTAGWTMATDSGLITLWLYASGGLASPFYALWLLSLVAVTFRFPRETVLVATGTYAAADVLMLAVSGDFIVANAAAVATRVTYILLVGALGSLLSQRWSEALATKVRYARELARQEERLRETDRMRLLSEAAFEGIIIHREGEVLEANPAACELFGHDHDALIGMHARDLVDEESLGTLRDHIENPSDEPYEVWIRNADGERRRVAVQARDLRHQGAPARVTALRDITEAYEAERAKRLAEDQRREIERLHEMSAFKSRFFNTAAHELNTPLTPIRLQLRMLQDSVKDQPRALDILDRNVARLGRLVEDILLVAKQEGGGIRVDRRPLDLAPVLDEVVHNYETTALERGIQLEALYPPRLMAHTDADRVIQVLSRVLGNAYRFTPEGGRVALIGRSVRDGVRIEVVDSGRGLSPEEQEVLFEPFAHGSVPDNGEDTGLGLHIARNIILSLGGSMGATSDGPGKGSTFWIELPATPPAPTDEAETEPPVPTVSEDAPTPS